MALLISAICALALFASYWSHGLYALCTNKVFVSAIKSSMRASRWSGACHGSLTVTNANNYVPNGNKRNVEDRVVHQETLHIAFVTVRDVVIGVRRGHLVLRGEQHEVT